MTQAKIEEHIKNAKATYEDYAKLRKWHCSWNDLPADIRHVWLTLAVKAREAHDLTSTYQETF